MIYPTKKQSSESGVYEVRDKKDKYNVLILNAIFKVHVYNLIPELEDLFIETLNKNKILTNFRLEKTPTFYRIHYHSELTETQCYRLIEDINMFTADKK